MSEKQTLFFLTQLRDLLAFGEPTITWPPYGQAQGPRWNRAGCVPRLRAH
jgi:hypothetical protein